MIGPRGAREAVAYDLAEDRDEPIPHDILRFNYASVVKQLADYADSLTADLEAAKARAAQQMTAGGHLLAVLAEAKRKGRKTIHIGPALHEAERRTRRGEPE